MERSGEFGAPVQQQEVAEPLGAHTEAVPTVLPKTEAAAAHQSLWILTPQNRSLSAAPAPITATVRPTSISASSALSPPSAQVSTSARQMASIRPISAIPVSLHVPVQPMLRPDESAMEQTAALESTQAAPAIATGIPQARPQQPQQPRRGLVRPTPAIAPPSQTAIRTSPFSSVAPTATAAAQPLSEQQQQASTASSESAPFAAAATGSSGADLLPEQAAAATMEPDLATRVTRPPPQILRAGAKRVAAASPERADSHAAAAETSAAATSASASAAASSFEPGSLQQGAVVGDFAANQAPKRRRPDHLQQQVAPLVETPAAGAAASEAPETQADDAAILLGTLILLDNAFKVFCLLIILHTYSMYSYIRKYS